MVSTGRQSLQREPRKEGSTHKGRILPKTLLPGKRGTATETPGSSARSQSHSAGSVPSSTWGALPTFLLDAWNRRGKQPKIPGHVARLRPSALTRLWLHCDCTAERSDTLNGTKSLLIISEHVGSVPRINCPIKPHSADPASFRGTCWDLLATLWGWIPEEQDWWPQNEFLFLPCDLTQLQPRCIPRHKSETSHLPSPVTRRWPSPRDV